MQLISDELIFIFTVQPLLPPESRCWLKPSCFAPDGFKHQTVKFFTRQSNFAPDSQILHQTCHVLHHSHSWNNTVVVGPRHVTVSNRQSRFTPDSRLLHHTVAFCTRKSHLAPDGHILHHKYTVWTIQPRLKSESLILFQIVIKSKSQLAPYSHC